jgi:hypothetical protein
MTPCNHQQLALLPAQQSKLRCRHCHLTIAPEELDGGYCPECYELHGKKHDDFEPVAAPATESARYRCEGCGIIIESES